MKTIKNTICSLSVLVTGAMFTACQQSGTISRSDNKDVEIYPDYKEVTIPCNIAAMNFSVCDSSDTQYALQIEAGDKKVWVNADGQDFSIPKSDWEDLVNLGSEKAAPKTLSFTVAHEENGEWVGGKPFTMTVVPDSIDEYITYRLIPPGYVGWYKMGIYQQQLSTSEQTVVFENSHTNGNCVNCHTVGSQRSDRTLFHSRTYCPGTYIFRNDKIERIEAKTDSTISAFVYPSWHPNGKYIAFSNNATAQEFHTADLARIEVFDTKSDVIVYDADTHEIILSPLLRDEENLQTFPSFTPDGKWLYFCSAPMINKLSLNYKDVHYALCRIAFDAEKGTFGDKVDTLYNEKSVSFPRISPDGKHIICTVHNWGNFSIWHKDADLYIADMDSIDIAVAEGKKINLMPMTDVNSDNTESYHTWSSSSRWLVFSSRRDDGLYTRPYFTYIDKEGKAHKPFMLPQENPRKYYKQLDYSYNIPEFMTSAFDVPMRDILDTMHNDSINVTVRK